MSSNNAFSDFAFEGAAVEPSEKPTTKKRKRTYRQAKESRDGAVEILCFSCRRSQSNKIQPALEQFLKPPQAKTWPCWRCTFENKTALGICEICRAKRLPEPGSKSADDGPTLAGYSDASGPFCSRCRKDMNPNRNAGKAKSTKALPIIARLQGYKRLAAEHNLPFVLEDHEAIALMRQDCVICGAKASADGHGITRLRHWPDSLVKLKAKCSKPYMGPFCKENTTTACGVCNLMKGARSIQSCVEAARHIATYRGKHIKNGGEDFGLYPKRFRHNISKRSRSSYITKSSTHQKTHCLTNEQFTAIVEKPCHYCGKKSDPPTHYNGLDRLDSYNRVYAVDTVVSCCGDCNVMKYKHSETFFLEHCLKIAQHNRGKTFEDSLIASKPKSNGCGNTVCAHPSRGIS